MIAIEQEDRDSGLCETTHLPDEKKAGLIVPPIAVIEVTSDDDEGDLLFDRLADEVIERDARCGPDSFSGRALLPGKSLERTIKMNVAGVNEAKRFQGETPLMQALISEAIIRFTGWPSHRVIENGEVTRKARLEIFFVTIAALEHKGNAIVRLGADPLYILRFFRDL
jgi:hypothetical protein